MSTRIPGDLNGDNILDGTDVGLYDKFIGDNNARTVMAVDTETHQVVMLDAINGGLSEEQCLAVSVHQNGYASYIDRMLVDQYINLSEPRPATLTDYINQLDSATIVPPVDPTVNTLQELRDDVTSNILNLLVYQADAMLKDNRLNMAAQSINDMRAKCEQLWSKAYGMDYNTIWDLDGAMKTGIETADTHTADSSWRQTTATVLETMMSVIMNNNVTKSDLERMRDEYNLTGSTFSDPPTEAERKAFAARVWALPVVSGCAFYDEYKDMQGSGGGGGDDPSQSLVPADPDSAPTPTAGSALATFISNCNSTYSSLFSSTISTYHPNQIITVKSTGGSNAEVNCYEVSGDQWTPVSGLTNLPAKVGGNGIHNPTDLAETTTSSMTPAGAWRLGNWSTCEDDIGAFGKDIKSGLHINYIKLTSSMYWIDGAHSQATFFPSWYNTFYDSSKSYHLIQFKRDDWGSVTVWNSDGSVTYNTSQVEFSPGKYYSNVSLNLSTNATEHLTDYIDTSYRNAVVIRFNMIPHVIQPITPGSAKSGSAFFLHSFNNDNNPGSTGGCVAVHNDKMVAILAWLDRTKSPYIFIGL